jgi:hypothetical protein
VRLIGFAIDVLQRREKVGRLGTGKSRKCGDKNGSAEMLNARKIPETGYNSFVDA